MKQEIQVRDETKYGYHLFIRKPRLIYLDEFLRLKCATDLLEMQLFPNAKEITESMAAYDACRRYLWPNGYRPSDPNVTVIVVGDGNTPRTAALFAFLSHWQCISIDPRLGKDTKWEDRIERLQLFRCFVEACAEDLRQVARPILIAVHSHASLQAARAVIGNRSVPAISIPCCKPQDLDRPPDHCYEDYGILSPERTVKVWETT